MIQQWEVDMVKCQININMSSHWEEMVKGTESPAANPSKFPLESDRRLD